MERKHRQLTDDEIKQICDTNHNWQKDESSEDIKGFCKSASIEEVRSHEYILTPDRYVGIEAKKRMQNHLKTKW